MGYLDEIVEMACLEGGVLAVVGERQELAGLGGEAAILAQEMDHGQRHDGGGGGTTLRAEGGEPAEITAEPTRVGHPAGQAETEGGGRPPAGHASFCNGIGGE